MGNMVSYLKWRGDLSFEEREFSLADNMIFSTLAYLDYEGIVSDGPVDLRTAADTYQKIKTTSHSVSNKCEEVLYACAKSRRYEDVKLLNYAEHMDEATHIQFAAITFILPDATEYIAFRGTDDSVNGWREDFCISYEVILRRRKHCSISKMQLIQTERIASAAIPKAETWHYMHL